MCSVDGKAKALMKNVGILTISNFSSKILIFLLVPFYTSILSTAEYGIYEMAFTTISLLYPIVTLNIVDGVMRFLMEKSCPQNEVIVIGLKYTINSIIIAIPLFFIITKWKIFNGLKDFVIFAFAYYVVYAFNQLLNQIAKGLDNIKDMAVAGVISTFILICANILFLSCFRMGLVGFFLANILSLFIPTVFLFFKLRLWQRIGTFKINKKISKDMLLYCTPLIVTLVGWWVNNGADKYVVTYFFGVAANGLLSVAYKIPSILNTLQGIFIQAWQISAIKEYNSEKTAEFYGQTFLFTNFMMTVSCAVLVLLTKPLASLLYMKDFYDAWRYVPFLLLSSIFNSASGFLGPILAAKKNSRAMAISAVYGAVVNVVLNIVLVQYIGIQGVTIATCVSSCIIYFYRKKYVGSDICIKSNTIVMLSWSLLIVQALIEIYSDMWYIELIIILLIFYINKNILQNIFNVIRNIFLNKKF